MLNKCQLHFQLRTNEFNIAYCYIRKNGCSTWKKFFAGLSPFSSQASSYDNLISFMGRYHKIKSIQQLDRIEDTILVLRDPLSRCFSAFINQYVMRLDRQSSLHADVTAQLKCSAEIVTFDMFLNDYLLKKDNIHVDAHFWLQSSHIAPIKYKHVWLLDDLYKSASKFFGEEIASAYFSKRSNSTSHFNAVDKHHARSPASDIFISFKTDQSLPLMSSFFDTNAVECIRQIYLKDYNLMSALKLDQ